MDPGALLFSATAELRSGIECAGIYVPCLDAQDGAIAKLGQSVRAHASLAIDVDHRETLLAEAREAQGFQKRRVNFGTDHDLNRWSAEHALLGYIPAGCSEQRITRRCQSGKIGCCGAGD